MGNVVRFITLEEVVALFVRDMCGACSKKKKCPSAEDRTACEFFPKRGPAGKARTKPEPPVNPVKD